MALQTIVLDFEPMTVTPDLPYLRAHITFGSLVPTPQGSIDLYVTSEGGYEGDFSVDALVGTGTIYLPPPAQVGEYSVHATYSGDSNYDPAETDGSFSVAGGTVGPSAPRVQAVAKPIYDVQDADERTRAQIEVGELAADVYKVTSITIQSAGSGYDAYSVATLAQGTTREDLTIGLGDNGQITSLTGFDPDTEWESPPRLTITRWTSGGDYIPG